MRWTAISFQHAPGQLPLLSQIQRWATPPCSNTFSVKAGKIHFACCWQRAAVHPGWAEWGWGISAQHSPWQTGQMQMLYFMQLLCFRARWDRLVLLAGCEKRLHRQEDCAGRARNFPAGLRLAEVTSKSNCCSYSCCRTEWKRLLGATQLSANGWSWTPALPKAARRNTGREQGTSRGSWAGA